MLIRFLIFVLVASTAQQIQAAVKGRISCAKAISELSKGQGLRASKIAITETENMVHYFFRGPEAYSLMDKLLPTISFGPNIYTFYFEKENTLKPYSMLDGGLYDTRPIVEGH